MDIIVHDSITPLRAVYRAPSDQRGAVLAEQVLEPLRSLWQPMVAFAPQASADQIGIAASFLAPGYAAIDADAAVAALDQLEQINAIELARTTLERCAQTFADAGRSPLVERVDCAILLGDPNDQAFINMSKGYTGFGGMPGRIIMLIWPNDFNLSRLQAAIAHEFHHNVRLSFDPWPPAISVGEYIVLEGLAESFAGALYGSDKVGPWVTTLTRDEIDHAKARIGAAIGERDWNEVRGYIFGDTMADQMGYTKQHLPYCAGYTIGYHVVQAWLGRTGRSIVDATFVSAAEIVADSQYFGVTTTSTS